MILGFLMGLALGSLGSLTAVALLIAGNESDTAQDRLERHLSPWTCREENCGVENLADRRSCSSCGAAREPRFLAALEPVHW